MASPVELEDVIAISVGTSHTCALIGGGINQTKCFGQDSYGELGHGKVIEEYSSGALGVYLPFTELGTGTNVLEIAAGNQFTCAVLNNMQAKCWGDNSFGQLGLGLPASSGLFAPGSVLGGMGDHLPFINLGEGVSIVNVATGGEHVCALLSTAQVKCWGWNKYGQLGLGVSTEMLGTSPLDMGNNLPVLNLGSSLKVLKVAAGFVHTCALFSPSFQLKCWGGNLDVRYNLVSGQLGLGSGVTYVGTSPSHMGDALPFVNVGSNLTILDFSLGFSHSCAIVTGNQLKCWGENHFAALGWLANEEYESERSIGIAEHEMGNSLPFVDVGTKVKVTQVALGYFFTCALTDTKQVKCWGYNCGDYEEECGMLGQGSMISQIPLFNRQMGNQLPYVKIGTGYTVTEIALSLNSLSPCVLLNNGKVKCWGNNDSRELGICIKELNVGISKNQMGNNLQFADSCGPITYYPTTKPIVETSTPSPTNPVASPTKLISTAPTFSQTSSSPTLPTKMPTGYPSAPVLSIAVGPFHTCLIEGTSNHQAQCFGGNSDGELGIESSIQSVGNSDVGMGAHLPYINLGTGLSPVTIAAGGSVFQPGGGFTCAVLNSGDVKCWGDNGSGQLGLGLPTTAIDIAENDYSIGSAAGSMGNNLPIVNLGVHIKATSIVCGRGHVCTLLSTSQAKCWGANNYGQLGLGVNTNPVGVNSDQMGDNLPIVNLGTSVTITKIGTGDSHTCALLAPSHQLKCFGWNENGQLGLGISDNSIGKLPQHMGDDLPFVNITNSNLAVIGFALGYSHTCAIVAGNQLKCWGDNSQGELGRVDTFGSIGLVPSDMGNNLPFVDVGTKMTVIGITTGALLTCVLTNEKQVKCWGWNGWGNSWKGSKPSGQLGQGSSVSQIPNAIGQMGDNLPYIQIGSGLFVLDVLTHANAGSVCVLLNNQKAKCWGANGSGQLGICQASDPIGIYPNQTGNYLEYANDCKTSFVPTMMPTSSPSQFPTAPTLMPTAPPSPPVIQITVGADHTCFVEEGFSSSGIQCFGDNSDGELGIESLVPNFGRNVGGMGAYLPFVDLGTGYSLVSVVSGKKFTCAILNAGDVKCWGDNGSGQLGLGLPATVAITPYVSVDFTVGSASKSMGNNLPVLDLGLGVTITSISCGGGHVCALLSTSLAKCWGGNNYGQLGLGVHTPLVGVSSNQMGDNLPILNLGTSVTVIKIGTGDSHTCVLLAPSHQLKCFGLNGNGQLGLGSSEYAIGKLSKHMGDDLPFVNITNSNLVVIDFALGYSHTCVIVAGNQLKCWGDNSQGELGRVDTFGSIGLVPSDMGNNLPFVDLGTNVLAIKVITGAYFTCALTSTGQVKCWGWNGYSCCWTASGQLGQGSSVSNIPYTINQMGDNLPFVQLGTGLLALDISTHSDASSVCALLNNRKVKCWGSNDSGQLGICNSYDVGAGPDEMGNYLQFANDCGEASFKTPVPTPTSQPTYQPTDMPTKS